MTPTKEKEIIPQYMLVHFEDDRTYFNKLDQSIGLLNTSLNDLKAMLIEQNRASENDKDEFIAYRDRTEEMVKAFENAKVIKNNDNERGDMIVKWSTRLTAAGVIIGFISLFLKKLL